MFSRVIMSLLLLFSRSVMSLCDPMDCSTPGFPVLHYLLELLKFTSIELVMLSNHLILIFSNELALRIKWPKYWSFSFSLSP